MKRVIAITLTVLLVSAIVFGGCGEAVPAEAPPKEEVKPIEWRFCSFVPPFDCFSIDAEKWADELEAATGGRMKVTFYWSESLVKMAGLYDAVASRTADMGQVSTSPFPERFLLAFVAYLPMIFETPHQTGQAMIALHDKYKEMRDQWLPCRVIWYQNPGPADIFSKFPVKTMEDLQGHKIQAAPKMEVLAWDALGMTCVPLMVTETYHALETGVVEATSGDFNQMYLWKLFEVTEYRCGNTIGTMRGFPTLMNIVSYDELPWDVKREFDKLTDPMAYTKRNNEGWEAFNAESTVKIQEYDKEAGNDPFYFLPDAERERWREVVWPVLQQWVDEVNAKGLPGQAILDDAIAFAEQYK